MYTSIEALPPLHAIVQTLTLKRLPVYTRINSIPLRTHSNVWVFLN